MLRLAGILIAVLFGAAAHAQNYSGSYVAQGQGGSVTLTLQQDAQGRVSGTLSGNGKPFKVQGQVQPAGMLGTAANDSGTVHILVQQSGEELNVFLAESGPGGQPDLSSARQVVMTRDARRR